METHTNLIPFLNPAKLLMVLSFSIAAFAFSNELNGQVYNHSNTTTTTCSGTFYDHNGSNNYDNNQTITQTFYPSTPGSKVRIIFSTFSLENGWDGLMIYNGNSTASPIISSGSTFDRTTCPNGAWTGTTSPGTITSTAADGSLTFRFTSDWFFSGPGWEASISCFTPCTPPGNPGIYGNNTWNVYAYNQHSGYNINDNLDLNNLIYRGYYTNSTLDITSTDQWDSGSSPSSASGYNGCPVNNDNHVVVYKRQGFPCGNYEIDLDGHDDAVRLYVDDVKVYQNDGCCADRGVIWQGYLDGNSKVEFRVTEGAGGSNLSVDFDLQPLNATTSLSYPPSPTCSGTLTFENPTNGASRFVATDFSTTPSNTSLYGSAYISGGEMVMTNTINNNWGGFYINNPDAINSGMFSSVFEYRIWDGSGADGFSFNYGPLPTLSGYANYENGIIGTGLSINLRSYTHNRIEIEYDGVIKNSTSYNPRTSSYATIYVTVDANNVVRVYDIDRTLLLSYDLTSDGYNTVDKSSWKFGFAARTGGSNDKHSLNGLKIDFLDAHEYSVDGSNWQSNPVFSEILEGTTNTYIRGANNSCDTNLGSETIAPPYPTAVSAGSDQIICNGSSVNLNGSADEPAGVSMPTNYSNSSATSSIDTYISNVTLNGYSTSSSSDATYTDNTATIISLNQGDNYTLSVTTADNSGSTYPHGISAYIDYNSDGDFDDINEKIGTTNSEVSVGVHTFSFTVPTSFTHGDRMLRVVANENTGDPSATGTYTYGETEDFTIRFPATISYSWSPSTSLNDPNISNPIASPTTTTTYTMTASFRGCSAQDNVTIDFYDGSWTGIEDHNWHNPNNWCNGIPTSTDDVVISSNAANMPEIHFNNATANNLTIISGASLTINNSQNLQLHGHFVNSGSFSMANGNETLILVGNNTNLSTNDDPVQHLSIESPSAIVLLQNNLQIDGNLTISDGELVTGSHYININGNISINGSLDATGSSVTLNGNNQQIINTNGNNAVFNELTIHNNSGLLAAIVLESNLHIAGHLVLTQGIIDGNTAPYKVKLLNGATANAGNTNSFINGEVERTGTTAFVYPVGDVANIGGTDRAIWAPVETDACALSTISANYYYENPPYDWWYHNGNMDASIDHVSDREYWDLSTDNATPAVTIYWTDNMDDLHSFGATSGEMTSTFVANNLTIAHYNTTLGKWDDMGANIPTGPIYFDDGKIKTTSSFSSYSPITFASKNPDFTLPVELKNFTAICKDEYVEINWTSATEINNEYFLLERMQNNSNWEFVAEIPGAGNSNTEINYQISDEQFNAETTYYRLTQFDFDGKFEIFKIISTDCKNSKDNAEITIFPNPFVNNINLIGSNWDSHENISFRISDMSGRLLKTYDLHTEKSNFQSVFYLGDLSSGMYMLEVFSKDYYQHIKIQKQ